MPAVLIVDDEAPLLALMRRFVGQLGYGVETAQTGTKGWEILTAKQDRIALVILDLTLPDMAGEDLLHRILALNDRVRVLVCSGYPASQERLGQSDRVDFLQKPFLPRMLEQAILRFMENRPI